MRTAVLALVFLVVQVGPATAKDEPGASLEWLTPEEAAAAVLKAAEAADQDGLRLLARRDEPDPWIVVDELCAGGNFEAASAFARAAPRKDLERLPAYVGTRRAKPDSSEVRAAFRTARDALSAGDAKRIGACNHVASVPRTA